MQAKTYTALVTRREDLIEEIDRNAKRMKNERWQAIIDELNEIDQYLARVDCDFEEMVYA